MRDDAVLRRALPLGRGLGRFSRRNVHMDPINSFAARGRRKFG